MIKDEIRLDWMILAAATAIMNSNSQFFVSYVGPDGERKRTGFYDDARDAIDAAINECA